MAGGGRPDERHSQYDALASSITEVSFALGIVTLVTGSNWAKIIWRVWWAWDPRLTSFFVCLLIYAGYIMLRRCWLRESGGCGRRFGIEGDGGEPAAVIEARAGGR